MNGWILLGIATAITVGAFLNGVRFVRMKRNPWRGRRLFGFPVEGGEMSVAQVNRFGWLQAILAPLFLLFFVALCFGLLGPVEGIQTIELK